MERFAVFRGVLRSTESQRITLSSVGARSVTSSPRDKSDPPWVGHFFEQVGVPFQVW